MGIEIENDYNPKMDDKNIIIKCNRCGTKNRVPENRVHEGPKCGRCKSPLDTEAATGVPINITDQTFDSEVLSHAGPVLVDCWAPWCGPCRMVAPVLDQLAAEYKGRIRIAKLNTDENPMTSSRYGIKSIPTMLIFNKGTLVNRLVGALPKEEIESHLTAML